MIEIQNNKILLDGKELQFDNKIIEAAEYEGKVVIVFETDEDGGYDNVLLKDYLNWKERPEIIGENNISDGVEIAGNNVTSKYGYYGKAAAWDVGDVHMKGGAGQMNTIYSWGTLKDTGIISDLGTAVIN